MGPNWVAISTKKKIIKFWVATWGILKHKVLFLCLYFVVSNYGLSFCTNFLWAWPLPLVLIALTLDLGFNTVGLRLSVLFSMLFSGKWARKRGKRRRKETILLFQFGSWTDKNHHPKLLCVACGRVCIPMRTCSYDIMKQ